MPWTRPSLPTLVTRVESDITSRLTGSVALLRRSILAILARVFAGAIHILHGYLEYLSLQLFVDTAEAEYLDRIAVIWGVPRNAAAFATGDVEFASDLEGLIIPQGTVIVRDDGVEFETDADAEIIGGVAVVGITCTEAGSVGNTDAAVVLALQVPIDEVEDPVIEPGGITGGTDQETDTSLRARVLARIQNPPAGGSEADYIAWAKSISGVENAWVYANYYGLGTVAVVFTVTGSNPVPSGGKVTEVQAYIDTVRPVTADVTVSPIVASDVEFEINIKPNTADLRAAVEAKLGEMFEDDAEPGGTLLISHINEAILTSGVEDFEIQSIEVDAVPVSIANIPFIGFNYPVLVTPITFGTLP